MRQQHFVDGSGYANIYDPESPMANNVGYVREHRAVMALHLGRSLGVEEVVHHIDGDKLNNQIENLELFASHSDHMKFGHPGKYPEWIDDPEKMKAAQDKRRKFWPTEQELRRLYLEMEMPVMEIARTHGVHHSAVCQAMRKWSIPTRPKKRAANIPVELLHRLYVEETKSVPEIAKILGFGSTAIYGRMADCGIPRRELSDAQKIHFSGWTEEQRKAASAAAKDRHKKGVYKNPRLPEWNDSRKVQHSQEMKRKWAEGKFDGHSEKVKTAWDQGRMWTQRSNPRSTVPQVEPSHSVPRTDAQP